MVAPRKIAVFLFLFSLFFLFSLISAQTQTRPAQSAGMSKPWLEGLREFHEVLMPIWHSAYPEKNYGLIRESVPAFKEKMEIINKAELPGFYREKKEEFEKKRETLAKSVLDLEEKSKGTDNQALLKATEELHTAYEQLVRFFAPRVKELEEFHLALYPLWHEALPNKDFKTIKASAPALEEKMDALMKAQLPERYKGIAPQFVEKRKTLKTSVDELVKACNRQDTKKIEQKLTKLHSDYQGLDAVFEEE